MRTPGALLSLLVLLGSGFASAEAAPKKAKLDLTLTGVNAAAFVPLPDQTDHKVTPEVIRAAVLLDRARFSPGSIDGVDGENFRKALGAYQAQTGLPVTSRLDQVTWGKLVAADGVPVLTQRSLTDTDLKGPFTQRLPKKFEAQSKLKRLNYRTVQEEIAEQVHVSPALLKALNPTVSWRRPGTMLVVPQVVVERGTPAKVLRIVVDKAAKAVRAFGADGKQLAFYPASIGSTEKPAPSGQFVIRRITHNPGYTYNPKYAFKGVAAKKPFEIAPGPNNPVGSVWMDLSIEGYGLHGTPEPELVGKTQSHGCIRLTNWNAEDLASMAVEGTAVSFEGPSEPAPTTANGGAPMH